MAVITLLTDFGTDSPYVAAMRGVILTINPAVTLVDLTHSIPPQNVFQAALVLEDVAPRFPAGTIHVAVVDPGVGTERPLIYAEIGPQRFVCPDNGLLTHLAEATPPGRIVRIENDAFWLRPTSTTFHGRDIMAPVAARLSLGLDPGELGATAERLAMLDELPVRLLSNRIEGHVVRIDSFGNIITDIRPAHWSALPRGTTTSTECRGQRALIHVSTYGQQSPGTLVTLFGSSDRLELAVVNGNAAQRLSAAVGDRVVVLWP